MKPRICVLGSINMDLMIRCDSLPGRGETKTANESANVPGGKGANQAVAASRLGAEVSMIGRVGDDVFATALVQNLQDEGIDTSHVLVTENCCSGYAVVAVEDSGENQIIVVPGANGRLSVADVEAARDVIADTDMLLLQLEVPLETVAAAIAIANEVGTPTMLDPAPSPTNWRPEFNAVDFLCPNESEAAAITRLNISTIEDAIVASSVLQKQIDGVSIVTLGEHGSVIAPGTKTEHVPAFRITPTDSTAAGDTFAGAFAVHFTKNSNTIEATRFANAAAALACTKPGAQTGMPTWNETMTFQNQ